jgi:hypothetical protein
VTPNPALKPSPNGRPPGPVWRVLNPHVDCPLQGVEFGATNAAEGSGSDGRPIGGWPLSQPLRLGPRVATHALIGQIKNTMLESKVSETSRATSVALKDFPIAHETVLEVINLVTSFGSGPGAVRAVDGISLRLPAGKTLCVAGESGCGKSVTALSIMGLLPDNATIESGEILFRGQDLVTLPADARRRLRGRELAMIFQEPMTALNPVLPVGDQIAEVYLIHGSASRQKAREQALQMLEKVT